MSNINKLKDKLDELKSELQATEEAIELAEAHLNDHPEYVIADDLHKLLCHNDHTEICGYYYENWSNLANLNKYASKCEYLAKAKILIEIAEGLKIRPLTLLEMFEKIYNANMR